MKPTKTKDFEKAFYVAVDENNQLRDMLTKAKQTETKDEKVGCGKEVPIIWNFGNLIKVKCGFIESGFKPVLCNKCIEKQARREERERIRKELEKNCCDRCWCSRVCEPINKEQCGDMKNIDFCLGGRE